MRSILLLLSHCALFAGLATAQTVAPGGVDHQRHLAAVHAERMDALLETLEALDPARREEVERVGLLARLPPLTWPDRALADRIRRELEPEPAPKSLTALVDALDLQAVPGTWTAASEKGPTLRVRLSPLEPVAAPVEAVVRLYWLTDEGEVLARTTPFERAALSAPGFDMYVRAPTGAGVHRLVLEVESEGRFVRGVPLELHAVQDLERRRRALDGRSFGALGEPLVEVLDRSIEAGLREPWGVDPERVLRALESAGSDAPDFGLVPRPLVTERGALTPWTFGRREGAGPVVVLIGSRSEDAAGVLLGARGERWRAALDAIDGLLVPLALGERDPRELIRAIRDACPDRPLVVLPRPDQMLPLLGSIEPLSADGALFFFQAIGPRAPYDGALPGAVLGLEALPEGAQAAALPGSRKPLLNELELATRLERWWQTR